MTGDAGISPPPTRPIPGVKGEQGTPGFAGLPGQPGLAGLPGLETYGNIFDKLSIASFGNFQIIVVVIYLVTLNISILLRIDSEEWMVFLGGHPAKF